jgi:hypothetical protein
MLFIGRGRLEKCHTKIETRWEILPVEKGSDVYWKSSFACFWRSSVSTWSEISWWIHCHDLLVNSIYQSKESNYDLLILTARSLEPNLMHWPMAIFAPAENPPIVTLLASQALVCARM